MSRILLIATMVPEVNERALQGPRADAYGWAVPDAGLARFTERTNAVPAARMAIGIDGFAESARDAAAVAIHAREVVEEGSGWAAGAEGKSALPALLDRVPQGVPVILFTRDAMPRVWNMRETLRTSVPLRLGDVGCCAPVNAYFYDRSVTTILEAVEQGNAPLDACPDVVFELERLRDAWPNPGAEMTPLARRLLSAYGADRFTRTTAEEGLATLVSNVSRPREVIPLLTEWVRERGGRVA